MPQKKQIPLQIEEPGFRTLFAKLRKRRIIETLAAFIGGGWLLVEVVERLLVSHYKFPEETIDLTVVSVIGALLLTLVWRWFGGTEKRPGNIKVEVLLVPLIILATLSIDLIILMEIIGIGGKVFLIAALAVCMGIAWIILKSLQWAAAAPISSPGLVQRPTGSPSSASVIPEKSIAVLPFTNMSADKENEYFCDGLSEEIINALSHIRELRVVARTSAFAFKGKEIDIREVGEKLNVGAVLEGSVRKSGQRLRITAQLVNVEDGYHLWSGQFDREMKDIFDIQEEISLTIVDHLKLKLLKDEKEKILKRPTEDHEAYDYYLKGRYFWYRRYEKGFQRGLQYFQQAIEKDPGYALAHMGIADTFGSLGLFSFMPPHQAYARAKAAAKKALEIDPELAEAYASLGWITMWYDWDWPAAERHFLKAIQMKPDYAPAHLWHGLCLSITGRFEESIREIEEARELEPLEPNNTAIMGWALYMARRFDESIGVLRKVIESDPEFSIAYWYLSANLMQKKIYGEGIATLQKLVQLSAESVIWLSALGRAYGLAGMKDEAFKILERLDGLSKDRYVGSFWRAVVWIGLGEKNEALENLEKAYLERESLFACLKIWPLLDSLRSDSRFKALLKKMNLDK